MPAKKPTKRTGREPDAETDAGAPQATTPRPGGPTVQFGPTKSAPGSRLKGGR